MTFHYQNFWFFWVYAGLVNFKSSNLHILKKIKHFDREKSRNLHILKKIKKIKNFRLYVGLTGIDELVFDFFDFFEYMQVWWLFTIIFFDFFEYMKVLCTFAIKMLIFFEYMQVWVYAGLSICHQNHAFLASRAGFGGVQVTKPAEGMQFWSEQSSN